MLSRNYIVKRTYRMLTGVCLATMAISAMHRQPPAKPDETRFTVVTLDHDVNEPMELQVAADGRVYYIERTGNFFRFDPKTNTKKRLAKLPVRFNGDDGLSGMALDPGFSKNRWVYFYMADANESPEKYTNAVVRYTVGNDSLSLKSRKTLLRVPLHPVAAGPHRGGSLAFDKNGNLYIGTGDETYAGKYGPIDEREAIRDAQRTSANTNDLRGKILRIHPEADGTYTIPANNLFPAGTEKCRPEIYIMGCRQPFRLNVDQHTNVLYWGEVGPDAGFDSTGFGPKGNDEFNRAAQAGNFGWPYFIGNNKPYNAYDYKKNISGPFFDVQHPVNNSIHNTGLKDLPPAQPALIWYPYSVSTEFPQLGKGGRNAIGGPLYYANDYGNNEKKMPVYYDGRWFIADWMRHKLFTVEMDASGNLVNLEPFLAHEKFVRPIDMSFAPDGTLYMLEYGQYWKSKNTDARLVRIEYNPGNRAPVAKISADRSNGALPLSVHFNAHQSGDPDKGDSLRYTWRVNGKIIKSEGAEAKYVFDKKGNFPVMLTVTDTAGKTATAKMTINAGNEPPQVTIDIKGNRSFYFDASPIAYKVMVKDREDGTLGKSIAAGKVTVRFDNTENGELPANTKTAVQLKPRGLTLINGSDCMGCHAVNKTSVGPSFMAIAARYNNAHVNTLASRIINGSGGIWTKDHQMAAHPQLSKDEAGEMVKYILSLKNKPVILPMAATVKPVKQQGAYVLSAKYTDAGGLTGNAVVILRPPYLAAIDAPLYNKAVKRNVGKGEFRMALMHAEAWIAFTGIDLGGITSVTSEFTSSKIAGQFEIREGSLTGPVIGAFDLTNEPSKYQKRTAVLNGAYGVKDLYFVFKPTLGKISDASMLEITGFDFNK